MKIDAAREGGSAVLQLEGRLDREWAERLSDTVEDLLQDGVRTLKIDFAGVTYVSTAATRVLARWHDELAILRGELRLKSLGEEVREVFVSAGWDPRLDLQGRISGSGVQRQSSWHTRTDFAANGQYDLAAIKPPGTLVCNLHGNPDQLSQGPFQPSHCRVVALPDDTFGIGLGAIGGSYEQGHERIGELIAVAGCVACFPSDGARKPDYLVSGAGMTPRAVLATGLTLAGGFSQLMRFGTRLEAQEVPLSELAAAGLEASGARIAGVVIAGETAGLSGVRLRRSPTYGDSPMGFELPAVRDWLSFAPERTYAMTTTLIAGVVAKAPEGPLAAHLRPLGGTGRLFGHFHAAVFSYHPLPQRTVELPSLVRGLFANYQLRDVLHLVRDDRGEMGVSESGFVRGVGWAAPVTQIS